MSEEPASRATALLVDEAWDAYREGRYPRALDAARRGVEAAELTGDLVALARALRAEGSVLQIQGDHAAALVRFTRILALAEDRATAGRHPASGRRRAGPIRPGRGPVAAGRAQRARGGHGHRHRPAALRGRDHGPAPAARPGGPEPVPGSARP